jgi:hypothetical protein
MIFCSLNLWGKESLAVQAIQHQDGLGKTPLKVKTLMEIEIVFNFQ